MKSVSTGILGLALSVLASAQTPAPAIPPTPDRLPVRRVVLYKSGVGYFEHLGKVRGNQTVSVDFTSGQLDEISGTEASQPPAVRNNCSMSIVEMSEGLSATLRFN